MKRIWAGLAMSIALASATAGGIVVTGGGTPEPPITGSCFSDPGSCGFPDPDYQNVGVPTGTALTPSGAITVSTPGAVITGLDITTSTSPAINVTANNVTIQNTRITGNATGGPNNRLITTCPGCNTLIRDVEMTTGTGLYEFAVHGCGGCGSNHSNDTLERVYQHGAIDMLLWCEGVCSVTDTYSHMGKPDGSGGWQAAFDNGPGDPDHLENLYCNDCTFTADHNTLFNPVPQTGVMFAQVGNGSAQPCDNNITMTDSLLAGGGFIIYACAHATSVGTAVVTFTGNRIGRACDGSEEPVDGGGWKCPGLTISHNDGYGYYPNGGYFGKAAAYYSASFTWSGNVWDKDSSTIPEP